MSRLPRLVLPGIPCHVTQRGNRRARTFFEDGDHALYRDLVAEAAAKAGADVWCYCPMPDHVHLIVVPSDEDGPRRTFADAHRRSTGYINVRNRWTGHVWQGRFGAVAMDEAHLAGEDDRLVKVAPVLERYGRFADFLGQGQDDEAAWWLLRRYAIRITIRHDPQLCRQGHAPVL